MLVYSYFQGDIKNDVIEMQYDMYSYATSIITSEVNNAYLYNNNVRLYLDIPLISRYQKINKYDHRIIQIPHDIYAAIFRYKYLHCEFPKLLFEETEEEIYKFHDSLFIDVDFLERVKNPLWYLTKRWITFLQVEIREDWEKMITRELAHALIVYNLDCSDKPKAWDAASKSAKLIKEKYNEVPWR